MRCLPAQILPTVRANSLSQPLLAGRCPLLCCDKGAAPGLSGVWVSCRTSEPHSLSLNLRYRSSYSCRQDSQGCQQFLAPRHTHTAFQESDATEGFPSTTKISHAHRVQYITVSGCTPMKPWASFKEQGVAFNFSRAVNVG